MNHTLLRISIKNSSLFFSLKIKVNHQRWKIRYSLFDVQTISRYYNLQLIPMREYFTSTSKDARKYRDDLFLIAIFYHRVFPYNRLIMLDVDLKFKIDISELYDLFNYFENSDKNKLVAVGRDLSPHYATGT